jgi:hypothetical protein
MLELFQLGMCEKNPGEKREMMPLSNFQSNLSRDGLSMACRMC